MKFALNISSYMFISFLSYLLKVTIKIYIICPRLRSIFLHRNYCKMQVIWGVILPLLNVNIFQNKKIYVERHWKHEIFLSDILCHSWYMKKQFWHFHKSSSNTPRTYVTKHCWNQSISKKDCQNGNDFPTRRNVSSFYIVLIRHNSQWMGSLF